MTTAPHVASLEAFSAARRDPSCAVLEGIHPIKHALRFGARITRILSADPDAAEAVLADVAPDLAGRLHGRIERITQEEFSLLVPRSPRCGAVALAARPGFSVDAVLNAPGPAPVVLLEDPRDLGNVGAVVRVSAAAGAAGVVVTGPTDPWHANAIRGSAGLHFALPVGGIEGVPISTRPLVCLDPAGDPLHVAAIPDGAVLAFGTERQGLSSAILDAADICLRIPMNPSVSSLNLATAVSAVLYAWRLR